MSKNHKEKPYGLSPYMIWVLVGMGMGRRIIWTSKKKYRMLDPYGKEEGLLNADAVNVLFSKQYIKFPTNRLEFILTRAGLKIASEKMKNVGAKPYVFITDVPSGPPNP